MVNQQWPHQYTQLPNANIQSNEHWPTNIYAFGTSLLTRPVATEMLWGSVERVLCCLDQIQSKLPQFEDYLLNGNVCTFFHEHSNNARGILLRQWASSVYHLHRCIADEAKICCRCFVCFRSFWLIFDFDCCCFSFWKCRGLWYSIHFIFFLVFSSVSFVLDF